MIVFLGEYSHNLDAKSRIIIPSKLRADLGGHCVITKGLDGCLFIFPEAEWQALSNKLSQLPLARREARSFTRFFFSSAHDVDCDKQGRIAVPPGLKEYADLDREVRIIGMHTRLEVWSEARWQMYQNDDGESFEQLAELMEAFDVGI